MNQVQSLSLLIFAVTILLIATERIHRLYASLLASGAMLLIGAVKPGEVLHLIDIEILGVIVGMMLLVEGAEKSGIFNSVAARIMRTSRNPTAFAAILLAFTAFLSMMLNNIGAMLVSASITITMTRALKMKPEMFLIFQAIVANLGGMMLMMSSIPNIIIAVEGGVSFLDFMVNIAPLGLILFALTVLVFHRFVESETEWGAPRDSGSHTRDDAVEPLEDVEVTRELRELEFDAWIELSIRELGSARWGWRQTVAAMIMMCTVVGFALYDWLGLTPALVALTGGFLMSMFPEGEPSEALREVDWSTVIFLAGLFVTINGLSEVGVIEILSRAMLDLAGRWPENLPITVMWLSAVPSGIIDNIPLTATFAPIIQRWVAGGFSADTWWGLVVGANLGGNLTPIGSPSNILVLGVSEQEGHPIPLARFFKICLGVTMMHLVVSTIYLYLMYGLR